MTADDLAKYSAEWVEPISIQYRDWTVYELPPNGDGMAALEMLNIMEQFKPAPAGPYSAAELHTRIEAMKLAYADVKAYDGDPRFSKIPVEQLLSKEYAAQRARLIDPAKANCTVAPGALSAATPPTFPWSIAKATFFPSSRVTMPSLDPASPSRVWDSLCRIAAPCFRSTPRRPTRSRATSAPFTPSFPHLWSTATSTSASASWAA